MSKSPFVTLITTAALVASAGVQDPRAVDQSQTTPPGQQQPAPPPVSYDVDVTLVEIDAVVTDEDGRVIKDLRADEFQVFEDGKRQTIDRVSFVEIPIERGQMRPHAARATARDVQTNLERFDGRLYVLLLDDLHTATSRTGRVKEVAQRFIEENLEPGDVAAVVHLSGPPGASQGFTSDPQLLMTSVDRFAGRALRSETLNLIDEYNREVQLRSGAAAAPPVEPSDIEDPDDALRADDARVVFDSITRIARQVEPVRGRRKALIWFGEGIAYDLFDASGRGQASLVQESERRAVAAAGRANLVVYGVDVRGLRGLGPEVMQLTSTPDPTTGFDASRLARELARSQDNLRQVSSDAGGFAIVNTEEFADAFERVVEENSAYYLLGYYPKNEKADGAYRSLDVRVTRPGAKVRARRGYTLSRGPTATPLAGMASVPAPLREALISPVARPGLPMAVHAAAFKGTADKASVLVTIEYGAAAFEGRGSVAADDDKLQASVIAVDAGGAVQASDHATVDLKVKPETQQAMAVLGFRTQARLALAPGRYQLRVGGLITGTGLSGSVYRDIEVPDFSDASLHISGLEITCIVAAYTPTAQADEQLRSVLPAPATTMRDFRNDDLVAVFAEVYEGGEVPSRNVTFTTTVRRPDGQVVSRRNEEYTAAELAQANGGYTSQVALGELTPGDYVLRLEVETTSTRPVGHDVAFRVWALESSPDGTPAEAAASAVPPTPALPVVSVVKGAVSGVSALREVVARNEEEWQALWKRLPFKRAAPTVTFDNTMVVAVFLGERATAGYQAEILGLRLEGETMVVEWTERTPQNPGNPPSVTTPFVVAGVPMHAGPVRFEKR